HRRRDRTHRRIHAGPAGGDDDLAMAGKVQSVEQVHAVAVRKGQVEQDQVGGVLAHEGPRLGERARQLHAAALVGRELARGTRKAGVVVDDQDGGGHLLPRGNEGSIDPHRLSAGGRDRTATSKRDAARRARAVTRSAGSAVGRSDRAQARSWAARSWDRCPRTEPLASSDPPAKRAAAWTDRSSSDLAPSWYRRERACRPAAPYRCWPERRPVPRGGHRRRRPVRAQRKAGGFAWHSSTEAARAAGA